MHRGGGEFGPSPTLVTPVINSDNQSWKGRKGPGGRGKERSGNSEFIYIKGTFYNVGKNEIYIN